MKILIGSDIVPTNNNIELFNKADTKALIGEELMKVFQEADFKILNLETPLTDELTPIEKCGPNLIAPTSTINGLGEINNDFYCLANNHIYDHGEVGLNSTINLLKERGISFSGVGRNLNEAKKPYIFEKDGISIGVYCCAEHEFSIATRNSPGANPYDPLESFDDVEDLSEKCDYVIVLYHGGKEFYRYPSPNLQKVFRKFADKGANLVIAQHTHCVGCKEVYDGSTLVYGQGNFLFINGNDEYWNTGMLLEVDLTKNNSEIAYIPTIVERNVIRKAKDEEAKEILKSFEERSSKIGDIEFLESEFSNFTKNIESIYVKTFKSETNFFKRLYNKITKVTFSKIYKKAYRLAILNFIECEAHREVVLDILKREITKE